MSPRPPEDEIGATRDLLESWGRAASQYRSRNRMAPEAPLTLSVPQWVPDMMQADLAREMPGAAEDRLAFTRGMVDRFFAARNLRVVYYMDSAAGKGQILGVQPLGAMVPWPSTVVIYLSHDSLFADLVDKGALVESGLLTWAQLNRKPLYPRFWRLRRFARRILKSRSGMS